MSTDEALLTARALVLADLAAAGCADPATVSIVEDALAARRWWVQTWPDGEAYLAGLVAQDVQDALLDQGAARWPLCPECPDDAAPPHELRIAPDLGSDPHWVCERTGRVAAHLGALPTR
jgi:hypothetical protein